MISRNGAALLAGAALAMGPAMMGAYASAMPAWIWQHHATATPEPSR